MQQLIDKQKILLSILDSIDIPDSAYEKAVGRYKDLGDWFCRDGSLVADADPYIHSQGSFRLGTVIRPLNPEEEYDLDITCTLRSKYTKQNISQKNLKDLIRTELETYRNARGIQNPIEQKHRCLRLKYKDELSFHMDIVPSIPEPEEKRGMLFDSMLSVGQEIKLASEISELAVAITDDRLSNYEIISEEWLTSNPLGFAKWFESRIYYEKEGVDLLLKAQVDQIPLFRRKTILQRCIQLLKRHRDQWFKHGPESKPNSMIITTLASWAYIGEKDLVSGLHRILSDMDKFIQDGPVRVPNPVNPSEDFADRWGMQEYTEFKLEDNFRKWLAVARQDLYFLFSGIESTSSNVEILQKSLGLQHSVEVAYPKSTVYVSQPAKPWKRSNP